MFLHQVFSKSDYSFVICDNDSELDFHSIGFIPHRLVRDLHKRLFDFLRPFNGHHIVNSLNAFRNKGSSDYVISVGLTCCGIYTFNGMGRDDTFEGARDQAVIHLLRKMISNPYFYMPRILYALPNPDGYCFLNSVLILLMYSPNFIQKLLFSIYIVCESFYEFNDISIPVVNPSLFTLKPREHTDDVRVAYILKELYQVLMIASIKNCDQEIVNQGSLTIRTQLIQHLAQRVHADWFYPNGHVSEALRVILKELVIFCGDVLDDLFIKMEGSFHCNHCGIVSNVRKFFIKFLVVPPKIMLTTRNVSLNSVLSNPAYWADSIEEICGHHGIDGTVCNGKPLGWIDLKCLKFPTMFLIYYVPSYDYSKMRLETNANIVQVNVSGFHDSATYYGVKGFTVSFQTYRSPQQLHRGERFGNYAMGDIPDEYHSVTCLAALDVEGSYDFVECNNGAVYPCEPLLKYIQPGSIWLYCKTDTDVSHLAEWLPLVVKLS